MKTVAVFTQRDQNQTKKHDESTEEMTAEPSEM